MALQQHAQELKQLETRIAQLKESL